jgi:hypothetical protein
LTKEDYHKFFIDQANEIKKHIWIESEKVGRDIHIIAGIDWVKRYAKNYRAMWIYEHRNEIHITFDEYLKYVQHVSLCDAIDLDDTEMLFLCECYFKFSNKE